MIRGVNYPWRHYGGDFGPTVWGSDHGIRTAAGAVAHDLHAIAAAGAEVVRWFAFTDARGGVAVDDHGSPAGFVDGALDDLDALFALAIDAGLRVVPVLFDHTLAFRAANHAGRRVGGHGEWLAEPEGQARLLERVVVPLAARYGARGPRAALGAAVYGWDLLNEPDWLVQELSPARAVEHPVPFDVLGAWIRDAAAAFRRHQAGPVTLGTARLRFAAWWDEDWLGLDFLQVHAYHDPAHDLDLLRTPYAALGVRRPVVVGECSARGEAAHPETNRPAVSAPELVRAAAALGYAGAWPWSWRGVDEHGPAVPEAVAVAGQRTTTAGASGTGHGSPS